MSQKKVIFLALTVSEDAVDNNVSVKIFRIKNKKFIKYASAIIDIATLYWIIESNWTNVGVKRIKLFSIAFGWSLAEALTMN